jgi:hypothetical protein
MVSESQTLIEPLSMPFVWGKDASDPEEGTERTYYRLRLLRQA